MNEQNNNTGTELLFLLRQQRYLYHQLKLLAERQRDTADSSSAEVVLDIVSGRRKLVEKLREIGQKLAAIRASWPSVAEKIDTEDKLEARKTAGQIREIVDQIAMTAGPESVAALPLAEGRKFNELFTAGDLKN